MSRHSKWSKIKHQKGVADKRRGALFTKLLRAVAIAAKEGTDPEVNFRLRLAIDQAKSANVPKETIERAILKAAGVEGEAKMEELLFEGFGPGGVAILIQAITDNRARTAAEIKHIFSKYNGTLAGTGAVKWMFEQRGILRTSKQERKEEIEMKIIESGAKDFHYEDDSYAIITEPEALGAVKNKLIASDIEIDYAGYEWMPKERLKVLNPVDAENLAKFLDELDLSEDVADVFTNSYEETERA